MTNRASIPWFAGSVGRLSADDENPVDGDSETGKLRLRYGGELSVARADHCVCLSVGKPRFGGERPAKQSPETDAQVWMRLLETRGSEAPVDVSGHFAAVWLRIDQSPAAMLVTDRFATWPLCYAWDDEQFHFSDQADRVPAIDRSVSAQALYEYLLFHVIASPLTIFAPVRRAPPGHVVTWGNGRVEIDRYWTPRFRVSRRMGLDESREVFENLVETAVERESGDGRVGAYLSGGTDSSTVAGMLARARDDSPKTFSIGFDAAGYDEMHFARIASRHFGTEHHEHYLTPGELLEAIPRVAKGFDQPFGNSSAVPAWVCARVAEEAGVTKLLAGDGGDELFAGNIRYAKQRILGWYGLVPRILHESLVRPVLPVLAALPGLSKGASYVQQASVRLPDRLHAYNLLRRAGIETVLTPQFIEAVAIDEPFEAHRRTWQQTAGTSELNRMLAYDWKYTLADNDLPKVRTSASLAGVDVGFPLLDDELVGFSESLPDHWKLRRGRLRWFFKAALNDFLPEEILTKQKHGFGLPFGVWLGQNRDLMELARGSVQALTERGFVRREYVKPLFEDRWPEHPHYYGEMIWILMVLELWLAEHAPGWRLT